jgi:hypothetical protein
MGIDTTLAVHHRGAVERLPLYDSSVARGSYRVGSANVRGVSAEGFCMSSGSNRQTTMAKLNRERRLKERRALKQEKKEARKQLAAEEAAAAETGESVEEPPDG